MAESPLDELLASIKPLVRDGAIELIEAEDLYIDLIERNFPFVGSKIDWVQVPGAIIISARAQFFVSDCLEFLQEQLTANNISPSASVAVVGDSAMDFAIATKAQYLPALMANVFDLPQHTYVVATSGEWCMAFTMEGEVAFGRSCKVA
jgi:hypothetical protein